MMKSMEIRENISFILSTNFSNQSPTFYNLTPLKQAIESEDSGISAAADCMADSGMGNTEKCIFF